MVAKGSHEFELCYVGLYIQVVTIDGVCYLFLELPPSERFLTISIIAFLGTFKILPISAKMGREVTMN